MSRTFIGIKQRVRTFQLRLGLGIPRADGWVTEVINDIENDKLLVYRPDDDQALAWQTSKRGNLRLEGRATLAVNIRDWLPTACQMIQWRTFHDDDTIGNYSHNGSQVLWPLSPPDGCLPLGPGAFTGIIGLRKAGLVAQEDEDWFKGLVAHEMVHAFNLMRFLVPAFMDWRAFWRHLLQGGCVCDVLRTQLGIRDECVDKYGDIRELLSFAQVK